MSPPSPLSSAKDFDPAPTGVEGAVLMSRIHGRLSDGTLLEGVEVFRQAYAAVRFGWVVASTRLPGISPHPRCHLWMVREKPSAIDRALQ